MPMTDQQQPNKNFLIAIVLIAALSLVFGVLRLRHTINASFVWERSGASPSTQVNTAPHIADALTLQKQDTDSDGLNDYDEINRYETSPYLSDSDSDGVTDAAEVKGGSDPNCPKGQECSVKSVLLNGKQGFALSSAGDLSANAANDGTGATTLPPFDVEGMRTLLVSFGALPKEQVDAMGDEELRNVYNALVSYLPGGSASGSVPSPIGAGSTQLNAPDTISADQIRVLLRQNGVDETLLKDIDDVTLQRVFRETVDQYETKKSQ